MSLLKKKINVKSLFTNFNEHMSLLKKGIHVEKF